MSPRCRNLDQFLCFFGRDTFTNEITLQHFLPTLVLGLAVCRRLPHRRLPPHRLFLRRLRRHYTSSTFTLSHLCAPAQSTTRPPSSARHRASPLRTRPRKTRSCPARRSAPSSASRRDGMH